ncbi:hypothetical protein D4764_06G0008620 [Takifugu flavidus]|uniref:Uncharacterized protein n=1 Tax=Takifugu flavidus TaxID=433684 RepID=A0A5C6MVY6_9TELE|nr:hypothetical protein D4764_06G0008620 [Takifugu flavidus]
MTSLVGYGLSSESEDDGHVAVDDVTNDPSEQSGASSSTTRSRNFLLEPGSDSNIPSKLPPPLLNTHSDSSVFSNPFKAQADQNLSALQKHVPLTMQPRPSQIGDKGSQNLQQNTREEDSGGPLKKRRVGLSNSLIPPKRAMKQYILQRNKEQVNMP